MTQLLKFVNAIFPELIELRRNIHSHPELAWEEHLTTEKIIHFFESHGVAQFHRPLETGVVIDIFRDTQFPWIAIRADIDALAIQDEKRVSYHSRKDGLCHACGHDVHIAVVSGVGAVFLSQESGFPVNLRLIFQPAEEPIPSGAPKMIAAGVLDKIQFIWGLHVEPSLRLGTVSLTAGWVNAQSIKLHWYLEGKATHSARPARGINPITAGTRLIHIIQQVAEEKWNRADRPAILSFTLFRSMGEAYNTIPAEAHLMATLRLTDPSVKSDIFGELHRIHLAVEKESGIRIHFEALEGAPPVVNDESIISRMIKQFSSCPGQTGGIETNFRSMGGDDFGWYTQHVPGALVRFGTGMQIGSADLHTGKFDTPEESIRSAILFFLCQLYQWS